VNVRQRILRAAPFRGPAPVNNYWSLLALRDDAGEIPGEEIAAVVRAGLLRASPVNGSVAVIAGGDAGPYGEIPDVEMTHRYDANDA
jgi:hypothetical protein